MLGPVVEELVVLEKDARRGSHPAVEVIDRSQEDVGSLECCGLGGRTSPSKHNQTEKEFLPHATDSATATGVRRFDVEPA